MLWSSTPGQGFDGFSYTPIKQLSQNLIRFMCGKGDRDSPLFSSKKCRSEEDVVVDKDTALRHQVWYD